MTTLTLTQRLQEGDSALERTVTIETDDAALDLEQASLQLVATLHKATWSTPDNPILPTVK